MGIDRATLEQCFDTMKLSESIWERIQRLRSRMESVTPSYKAIGGRGSDVADKVGNGVVALDSLIRQFDAETTEYARLAADVNEAIQLLKDPRHRNIMGLRYLDGLNWDDVADRAGYSVDHCYRLNREAMMEMGMVERPSNVEGALLAGSERA